MSCLGGGDAEIKFTKTLLYFFLSLSIKDREGWSNIKSKSEAGCECKLLLCYLSLIMAGDSFSGDWAV